MGKVSLCGWIIFLGLMAFIVAAHIWYQRDNAAKEDVLQNNGWVIYRNVYYEAGPQRYFWRGYKVGNNLLVQFIYTAEPAGRWIKRSRQREKFSRLLADNFNDTLKPIQNSDDNAWKNAVKNMGELGIGVKITRVDKCGHPEVTLVNAVWSENLQTNSRQ